MEHALNLIRALSKTVFWPFRSSIKFDIMGSRVYNLAILSKDLISRNNCKNDFPSPKAKKMAYLKTLRCVLYSLPPQNGERPPDTIMYIMTPRLHKSDNGEAWLHFMTSGLMNSNVPHMLMGIMSPFPGAPNDRARPKSRERDFRIFNFLYV